MLITLITLALAAIGFVWGRIRADIVALLALMVLTVSGIITTQEALSGFSNPIVIMMVGLFVVGGAIFNTGLAKTIGARLLKLGGGSETRLFIVVMGGTALIGGFVSNTGTVALMLPIVVSMAAAAGGTPRRLLMPLAFASSLGGMLTLIGTPPNLVIAEVWEEYSGNPLTFFTFLPAGAVCLVAGTLLLIPLSKWFLGKRTENDEDKSNQRSLTDLVEEYGLNADLYRVTVGPGSPICGKSLGELKLRHDFGVEVLEVRSGDTSRSLIRHVSQQAPTAATVIENGDTLYLRGAKENIGRFVVDFRLTLDATNSKRGRLQFYDIGIAEIVPLPNSPILKDTIAALDFSNRFSVNVIGIRRKNVYLTHNLGEETVRQGDVLLVQGPWQDIARLGDHTRDWVVLGQPLSEAAKVTLDYKAPLAAIIMLAMVLGLVFEVVPAVVTVLLAALAMVLVGCFRNVSDAYKTINWESIVLIAAMMPMSFALDKTGVSAWVADSLVESLGGLGPHWLLAGVYFTTSIMTLFISNTATAVLLAPIALESAIAFGVNPLPFLFAVTFGASLCFASPFSTPPNALVMPAGQYTFTDYLKVGAPLQILLGLLMIFVLPFIFPF